MAGTAVTTAAIAASLALVAVVDPHEPGHYPLCPFRALTGLDCPLCGGLRAAHDVATGDVLGALDDNLLLTLGLAVVTCRWLHGLWRSRSGRPPTGPVSPRARCVIVAVTAVFWVARNLPGMPFLPSGPG